MEILYFLLQYFIEMSTVTVSLKFAMASQPKTTYVLVDFVT